MVAKNKNFELIHDIYFEIIESVCEHLTTQEAYYDYEVFEALMRNHGNSNIKDMYEFIAVKIMEELESKNKLRIYNPDGNNA